MRLIFFQHQLPILIILLPLLLAPVIAINKNITVNRWLLQIASLCLFILAICLLLQVQSEGVIHYALGGWDAPWGIELYIDFLSSFILILITGINLIAATFLNLFMLKEINNEKKNLFLVVYLLNMAGMCGIALTGDAFNLFVFIEISSLSSYALISLGQNKKALFAAFRYLILGTVGASFYLLGVGILYSVTGTLNLQDLIFRLQDVPGNYLLTSGYVFILAGLLLKAALFPLHTWMPAAYTYAPAAVSILLSGTSSKLFIYVIIRIFSDSNSINMLLEAGIDHLIMALSIIGIFYGSISAIYQNNLKNLLACSSIAQTGYIFLGISLFSQSGYTAALVYMMNHALIKSSLFAVMATIAYDVAVKNGELSFDQIKAYSGRSVVILIVMIVLLFNLIGIPGTAGFISKWQLLLAATEHENYLLIPVILVASTLSAIYSWKIIDAMYFQSMQSAHNEIHYHMNTKMLSAVTLIIVVLSLLCIYLGMITEWNLGLSELAMSGLTSIAR